jgi:hypothetical protein
MEKQCFKCGEIKPLSEYYKHKDMTDGHLNKCKTCAKKDVEDRRLQLEASDPLWAIAERKRQREKSRKYRDDGRAKPQPAKRVIDPAHKQANSILGNAIRDGKITPESCIVCGNEKAQAHHEDYSKPLSVHWLCTRHHNDRHIHIRDCKTLGKTPLSLEHQFDLS